MDVKEDESEAILREFREFLVSYLRGKSTLEKRGYPWKDSWQYIVSHSLRVESYAKELIELEGGLSESEALMIRAAALMHDIGSLDDRRRHAKTGAGIVENFCRNKSHITARLNVKTLLSLILTHQKKDGKEKKLPYAILKDSDILDELGAMSIFMISHQADRERYDYYAQVLKLLERNEYGFFKKQEQRLSTLGARKIMRRKFAFIKQFALHLRDELKGTEKLKL